MTNPLPTSTRPSGSIRSRPRPMAVGAPLLKRKATTTEPLPTSMREFDWNRKMRFLTTVWDGSGRRVLKSVVVMADARDTADATKACELTKWQFFGYVGTLAAANAEAEKFDKAIEFQLKAVEMATSDKEKNDMRERLKLYQAGKPYRDVKKK